MNQTPDDDRAKQGPVDTEIRIIGGFLQSLAIGLVGVILACISALPDACDHTLLMRLYIIIIKDSAFAVWLLWTIGTAIKLLSFSLLPNKNWKETLMPIIAVIFCFIVAGGFYFGYVGFLYSALKQLPKTQEEAITFCEGPPQDQPQEYVHPMFPLW